MSTTNETKISPRPYQADCISAIFSSYKKFSRSQLVVLPTGSGKTIIFALLAKQLDRKTLILAHTDELITQAKDKLLHVWPEVDLGIVKGSLDDHSRKVVIASVQTASKPKRLAKLIEQGFSLLIVDEAHHACAQSYKEVIQALGFNKGIDKLLLGVTATPFRADGQKLSSVFKKTVFERSIKEMIEEGFLSLLLGKKVYTDVSLNSVKIHKGDFQTSSLSEAVNVSDRNSLIVSTYKKFSAQRKKVLCFCVDVRHASELAKAFKKRGVDAEAIHGKLSVDERKETLRKFSDGEISVLTSCMILTEGFDEPKIDCVLLARPTKSRALFTQMIGRGCRLAEGKENCLILDFTDNCWRFKLCSVQDGFDGAIVDYEAHQRAKRKRPSLDIAEAEIIDPEPSNEVEILAHSENIEFFEKKEKKRAFFWLKVAAHFLLEESKNISWVVVQKNEIFFAIEIIDLEEAHAYNFFDLDSALTHAETIVKSRSQTFSFQDAFWRKQPPSSSQINLMRSLGIYDATFTKGEASDSIAQALRSDPVTENELRKLNEIGVDASPYITRKQAENFLENYNERKKRFDDPYAILQQKSL